MNRWTELSIEYANQRSYLDDLFQVYPTIPEGIRDIDQNVWEKVESAFSEKNNSELLKQLFKLDLFPLKDSYVAFLKKDKAALDRNPKTVNRLCGRLYEMGLNKIFEKCSEAKETNRQIGPMFGNWLNNKSLGIEPVSLKDFLSTKDDAVLKATDEEKKIFAKEHLNYNRDKGLDFVGRFNGKFIIGEAKFLSDFGGSQNSDFEDAIATLEAKEANAVKIAILDGVLYLKGRSKMHKFISNQYKDYKIMSALVLREFLYQI
jgi:hypothetical protein